MLALGHGAGGEFKHGICKRWPASCRRPTLRSSWSNSRGQSRAKGCPAPSQLDAAWLPLIAAIDRHGLPLIAGVGPRVLALRVEPRLRSALLVWLPLAFPLHPPGRPQSSRIDELTSVTCPALVIQGTRDTFGTAAELRRAVSRDKSVKVRAIADADHGFKVAAAAATTTAAALKAVVKAVNRESDRLIGC